jgi:signal transduction histidine kinase
LFVDDDKEILKNYELMFRKEQELNTGKCLNDLFGNDDNIINDDSLKAEYDVHTVDQGEKAILKVKEALLSNTPFKVAFVDMRMPPGIDGKETASQLRQLDPDLEIVIVTAYSDHDLDAIVNDIGQPDKLLYVKKPFDPAEIKQCALCLTTKWNEARIKDDFLANISHELKTPLASIIGFSDILVECTEATEEIIQYSSIIKNNGKMMKYLVEDLITMVRLGKSDITIFPSKVNINELLKEAISMFTPVASVKPNFQIETKLSNEDIIAEIDRERFLQCFVNFISNAVKYTVEGHVEVYTKFDKNGKIEIGFNDTGIGIEEEYLEVIFEKFERLEKDHHAIPGLGLGLSICKKVIDLHEAQLVVESKKNVGSSFKIIL